MMFNFFVRSFCFATYRVYLLLRYCTFLRRGTLEGYVVVVVVTLFHCCNSSQGLRTRYLSTLPT